MHARYAAALLMLAVLISSCSSLPGMPPAGVPTLSPPKVVASTGTAAAPSLTPLKGCAKASLRIRKEPNTQSEVLGAVRAGECVMVYKLNGEQTWAAVEHDGYTGWVALQYLTIEGDTNQLALAGGPIVRTEVVTLPTATRQPTSTPKPVVYATRAPSLAAAGLLNCASAGKYVGEFVTCRLPYTYCTYQPQVGRSPTFCSDRPLPGYSFTLVAWGEDWSRYDGKCLVISGLVTNYEGKAAIEAGGETKVSLCP